MKIDFDMIFFGNPLRAILCVTYATWADFEALSFSLKASTDAQTTYNIEDP